MRVLSGIQPSGQLHLGNYFGSIRPNVEMSAKADQSLFFIADLHALTTVHDAKKLKTMREDIFLDYLACGFNPEKSVLYYQSRIPAHTELLWILSTIAPMGLLERAVSYKDKIEKGISASVGLFTYPVLMAADILLYDANVVPVGKDQKQHVEIARDIAMKFNNTFGEVFVIPEPMIQDAVSTVPGTDGQKMSKSYGNVIPIFGDEKVISKSIMGIVTDSKDVAAPKDPDDCVVYKIHSLFLSSGDAKELAKKYRAGGLGYGDAKKLLVAAYMDHFAPIRKMREELQRKPDYVRDVMMEGEKKARGVAEATMSRVREAVGLA